MSNGDHLAFIQAMTMLKICFPDHRQESIWVVDKSFSIGSADDNHLVIDDPSVSLQHARLILVNDVYTLHDLGSQNGTRVNGQPVTQRALNGGDRVRVGDVDFDVVDPAQPHNQPEWLLVACSSWLSGQEFPVRARNRSRTVKIGRASHCDLIFPGTHLSREHVQLTVTEQGVQVRDLNSANGTFINDARVSEGMLYSGDELRLDVYSFKVFGPAGRPPADAPADESDDNMTKLRPRLTVKEKAQPAPVSQKQWKTRSTSPGNRDDAPPVNAAQHNTTPKIVAAVLALAVIGLAIYLIVG